MTQETTEVTLINPKQSKPPSSWFNTIALVLLFALIMGAKQLSDKWLNKAHPIEDEENQIVMEDLESEKPLAESMTVEIPQVEGVQEIPPSEKIAPELAKQAGTEVKIEKTRDDGLRAMDKKIKNKIKQKRRTSNIERRTKKSPYAVSDPYTDGGPLDLDRPENREQHPLKTQPSNEATATPPTPTEEGDHFIPFESD